MNKFVTLYETKVPDTIAKLKVKLAPYLEFGKEDFITTAAKVFHSKKCKSNTNLEMKRLINCLPFLNINKATIKSNKFFIDCNKKYKVTKQSHKNKLLNEAYHNTLDGTSAEQINKEKNINSKHNKTKDSNCTLSDKESTQQLNNNSKDTIKSLNTKIQVSQYKTKRAISALRTNNIPNKPTLPKASEVFRRKIYLRHITPPLNSSCRPLLSQIVEGSLLLDKNPTERIKRRINLKANVINVLIVDITY